ncbi:MAG: adenine phosphoribosyltransferase [Rhodothermales bacterium]
MANSLEAFIRTIPDFPKSGIQFKDITPLLADPVALQQAADALAEPYRGQGITKVVGIEARGFIFGPMLASLLSAGFIPARKPGKLPAETRAASYALEYGTDTIEMHADALTSNDLVLIHDDVIATGGTASAAAQLVAEAGASLAGFSFIVELAFLEGRTSLPPETPVASLFTF